MDDVKLPVSVVATMRWLSDVAIKSATDLESQRQVNVQLGHELREARGAYSAVQADKIALEHRVERLTKDIEIVREEYRSALADKDAEIERVKEELKRVRAHTIVAPYGGECPA